MANPKLSTQAILLRFEECGYGFGERIGVVRVAAQQNLLGRTPIPVLRFVAQHLRQSGAKMDETCFEVPLTHASADCIEEHPVL